MMIILHLLFHPDSPAGLLVTGEVCAALPLHPHQESGNQPTLHPAAADAATLTKICSVISPRQMPREMTVTLPLPAEQGKICCSPDWYREMNLAVPVPDGFRTGILPAIFCTSDIIWALDRCRSEDSGFIPGGTTRVWIQAGRLGAEMIRRGRYLPDTGRYHHGGTCTTWTPVPSSLDRERIRVLSQAMPGMQPVYLSSLTPDRDRGTRYTVLVSFLKSLIHQVQILSEDTDPDEARSSLTPIEKLRSAEELTALWFLQGRERHLMPIDAPHLTGRWLNTWRSWTTVERGRIPDDPPWTICGRIEEVTEELPGTSSEDGRICWRIRLLIRPDDMPDCLLTPEECISGGDLPRVPLPGPVEVKAGMTACITTITTTLPHLEKFCTDSGISGVLIPEEDLIRFLSMDVPVLQREGVPLILPVWWGGKTDRLSISLHLKKISGPKTRPTTGLERLRKFSFQLAAGNDPIDPDAFREMYAQKSEYLKAGSRWIRIESEQAEKVMDIMGRGGKRKSLTPFEILTLLLRTRDQGEDLTLLPGDEEAESLLRYLKEDGYRREEAVPESFQGILRPYQKKGLSFLKTCRRIGFGSLLADEMGLGKTPQTIAYLLACRDAELLIRPALIITPTSVIGTWEKELRRFAPSLSVYTHHGSGRQTGDSFRETIAGYDIILTSYALASRDQEFIGRNFFSSLVLDEVQNVKNSQTRQFHAIASFQAAHRVALTGTPVENRIVELWSVMEILNPGYLGSRTAFRKKYATPIEEQSDDEAAAELRLMIRPFLLRRKKTDETVIRDLPEKMEMQVLCSLTHEQASLYQAVLQDLTRELASTDGMKRRGTILAALTRLKQVCDHPGLLRPGNPAGPERSGKVTRLIEMLQEVDAAGEAAIIFTQYAGFARMLAESIHGTLNREVLLMTGGTPRHKRDELIHQFMHRSGPPFFVISLRAGGTGLNLTRATHVFHADRWWNPAVEDQATDRTYRIGQTRRVQVHRLITAGTLEEEIDEMIQRKRDVADQVITSREDWITELSTGELMDILRMREGVFGDEGA